MSHVAQSGLDPGRYVARWKHSSGSLGAGLCDGSGINQCHRGVSAQQGVCSTCEDVWFQLASTWSSGSSRFPSRMLLCGEMTLKALILIKIWGERRRKLWNAPDKLMVLDDKPKVRLHPPSCTNVYIISWQIFQIVSVQYYSLGQTDPSLICIFQ